MNPYLGLSLSLNTTYSPYKSSDENIFGNYSDLESSLGFGIPDNQNTRRIIHYLTAVYLILTGLFGSIGNGLVLLVFTKYQRLRSGGGPLILSLAAGDLMVSLLHGFPAYSSLMEKWEFGDIGCSLYAGATGIGGLASLITLSAIAADRFCVIFGKPKSWLARQTTCFVIWFLSLCLVTPPFFGWSKFCLEGMGTSCSWDYNSRTSSNRIYYIFLLSFGFLLPLLIIIVSYIGILHVVYKHSRDMKGFARNGLVCTLTPSKTDIRTAQVIFTLISCFLVSWTPYAIVSLIGQFGTEGILSPLATSFPALFAKGSVIYNPIVYGLSHPHFRSAVRSIWSRRSSLNTRNLAQQQCYQPSSRVIQTMTKQPSSSSKYPLIMGRSRRVLRHSQGFTIPSIRNETMENELCGGEKQNSENRRKSSTSHHQHHHLHHSPSRHQSGNLGRPHHRKSRIHSLGALFNYSEPDLHRDSKIVKNPNLITQNEYKRRKQSWLWKVLFRSENCLDHVLRSDGFQNMAKLARRHELLNSTPTPQRQQSTMRRRCYSSYGRPCMATYRNSYSSSRGPSPSPRRNTVGSHSITEGEKIGQKYTNSILHTPNKEKRGSNLLTLPLRFEDGIGSGEEEDKSPSRRSSSGRKSSSSGSKGSGNKRLPELSPRGSRSHSRRKSSNNSEMTGTSSYHCAASTRSGSQAHSTKKFSMESTASKHQWKYFLMHQRDCCECSFRLSSSCPQESSYISFD